MTKLLHTELGELLDDDYTFEEFMADICSDEVPCALCKRRGVSSLANVRGKSAAFVGNIVSLDYTCHDDYLLKRQRTE